ncbi:thioredoxin domain-containing protein [Candidatus Uhrbacteria bacterium]|nr:thioredoxin domain-containing protein [Candidatus Uhrbacteria bacterium]
MDMDTHPHEHPHAKTFFDVLPSRQAFWLGFVAAILTLGTLGFVVLGSCLLNGNCSADGLAVVSGDEKAAAPVKAAAADAQPAAATGVPVVTADDHIRGDVNAPVTIIEYSDFECPYCQRFHPTMQQVMAAYEGKVRWVLRSFPLSFHPNATPAALAAECAAEQGKYWEFADKLFENRDTLGDALYTQLATDLGLNVSSFSDCYTSEKYADKIQTQAQEGAAAGVSGTPGSFVIDADGNATPIKGALPFESVAAAIDAALE